MGRIRPGLILGFVAILLIFAVPGLSQGRHGGGAARLGTAPGGKVPKAPKAPRAPNGPEPKAAPLEEFSNMSAAERERALSKLPADKREKIQKQLETYDRLTPEQRARVQWFQHLPPARQDEFRKAFQRFQNEPADRQQAMRQELNRLRSLSDAERKSRLKSADFKDAFNDKERKILSEMSDMLAAK